MNRKDGGTIGPRMVMVAIALALAAGMIRPVRGAEEKPDKDWLVGEWTGQLVVAEEALNKQLYGGAAPSESIKEIAEDLRKQLDLNHFTLTFKDNGTWLVEASGPGVEAKNRKQTGKWKVVKTDGPKIKVKFTYDADKTKEEEQTFVFSGRKSLTQQIDNFVFPQFEKKQSEKK